MKHKTDLMKEFIWNMMIYILYFVYCFIMIMLFHMIFYSILNLNWKTKMIVIMAIIGSTCMMMIRMIRLIRKKKK